MISLQICYIYFQSIYELSSQWSFNIERNIPDRSDLVITVCSQKLIIGRYVLHREEFAEIPDTKSGVFEVKGSIINGAGLAGSIKLICQKGTADRPSLPKKNIPITSEEVKPPKDKAPSPSGGSFSSSSSSPPRASLEASSSPTFILVKIVSVAVIEMKAVHLLESNSPSIFVECGRWAGVSDVVRSAGPAARWTSLNWRLSVKKEENIVTEVKSNTVLIGKVSVSMDEILAAALKENGMREVIKHIENGKEITGKIKFNFVAKVPDSMSAFPRGEGEGVRDGGGVGGGGEGEGVVALAPSASSDEEWRGEPSRSRSPSDMDESQVRTRKGLLTHSRSTPLQPPFMVRVHELTVMETVRVHVLTSNALSVTVACGAWGSATEVCPQAGQNARYINLGWKVPVLEGAHFRINVWSRGVSIGSCSLSAKELLEMPTEADGRTDIFAKIVNDKKETTGKVKIECRYDAYVKDNLAAKAGAAVGTSSTTKGTLTQTSDDTYKSPAKTTTTTREVLTHHTANLSTTSSLRKDLVSTAGSVGEESRRTPLSRPLAPRSDEEKLSFPVLAVVKAISVFDLHSVHIFAPNAPQILFKV